MAGIPTRETTIRLTSPGFAGVTIRLSGMICARREAGAHPPAISTPSRSPSPGRTSPRDRSRPDPRGGRARPSLFLPVLALLLGAMGLFVAAPAQAQSSEVWSATLRVDAFGNGAGCDSDIETCSSRLSPNAFVYKGPTYTIQGLLYFYTGQLRLRLSGRTAAQTKSDLGPLTLVVGGTQKFKVKDAGTLSNYITWSMSNPSWSEGQQVSMKLMSLPKKPTGLSAKAGDRQVTLRWNNPNDGAITKYQIYVSEDGAAGSWSDISGSGAATTSHTVTDLKIGTIYSFYIRAVNALGNSPRSDKAQVKVLPLDLSSDNTLSGLSATSATSSTGPFSTLPLTPSTFSATRTSYTATVPHATTHVKLTPVATEENAVVEIRKGSANVFTDSSGTTAAIALDVGANAITVQVTAQDSSTRDYTVTITRQASAPPAAPQNLVVTPGNAKLELSWTAPSGAVTGYDVHYTSADATTVANDNAASGSDPSTAWVVVNRAGSVTSQEITGLDNGRPYRVRVRARNTGARSSWVHGRDVPAGLQLPQNLQVTPGDRKLVLTWTAVQGATGYDVHYESVSADSGWMHVSRSGAGTSQEITGLTNGHTYQVRISAKNDWGASGWTFGKGTPRARARPVKPAGPSPAALQPPQDLTVTPGDRKLELSWTAPSGAVTGYDV
ncbi:MAG: fibronectin type III domain-containing protein, partial [Paracoccaceae bacterium]|nr:fibronectin type III domain-containing protein [Paracoccaceae bacterium]